MHPVVLIPLFAGTAAVALAVGLLARSGAHRANRLLAAILCCSAYWSLLEVIWNTRSQETWVPWLVRISSLGWMPLGVLCIHLFLESSQVPRPRLRRALPAFYALTAACIGLYIATPWGIEGAVRTAWGWSFRFGPLFPFLYTPVATLTAASLAVMWRSVYPANAPANERRQGWLVLVAIAIPLTVASATDAVLPYLGIHVPRLGSSSVALVGATVAWSIHRYGYSLLAPGAYSREILATLRDGVVLVRRDGGIRSANESFARMVGARAPDLLGDPVEVYLPGLLEDPESEHLEVESELVPRAEPAFPVSVSKSTLRDKTGEPVGSVLSVRDLREVTALRRSLLLAGRLAAVGELAAGISHEINNPIAYVQSNLGLLEKHWSVLQTRVDPADPELREILQEGAELLEESRTGIERVTEIVRDVRAFSHEGRAERESTPVHRLIEDALRMATPQLRNRVRVERHFGSIPDVWANPQELRQVFLNLVVNAAQAIEDRGTLRVTTRSEGPEVVIELQDDGCGIPAELVDRIFDPFFTTKRVGEGTGLGLALSYQVIRKHGGDILVRTEGERGTCFEIRLPAWGEDPVEGEVTGVGAVVPEDGSR